MIHDPVLQDRLAKVYQTVEDLVKGLAVEPTVVDFRIKIGHLLLEQWYAGYNNGYEAGWSAKSISEGER